MEDFLIWMGVVAVVALFILYVVLSYRAQAARIRELAELAARLGLSFNTGDPYGLARIYGHFRCIDQGHSRSASNVISGRLGEWFVCAFDYTYYTTSTRRDSNGRTTTEEIEHSFSAAAFDTDLVMPNLFIRPEGLLEKMAGVIGFRDINFESDEFSRLFHVESADRKFAYDVIHPQMMEFLLEYRGYTMELSSQSIMITWGGRWRPEGFEAAIRFGEGFLQQFPHYLKEQLRTAPGEGQ